MKQIGKVHLVCNKQEGVSNDREWVNETLVLETGENRYIAFEVRGAEDVAEVEKLTKGQLVEVKYSVESREYKERWYTSLRYQGVM